MSEEDVETVMRSPLMMVGSDGRAVAPYGPLSVGKPHPRYYGTFVRVLGRYVREKKILTLESAIRKMTSLPARRLGILDRGLVKEGMWADLTLFDHKSVADRATFTEPHQYASGVAYVIVNGEIVVEKGEHTGARPGRALRGSGYTER
jgi:N-acyl-D-amino-acid deacylase